MSRDICDDKFERCLKKKCGKDQQCKSNASLMKLGTNIFGCQPYKEGQRQLCKCYDTRGTEYNDAISKSIRGYYKTLSDIDESYGKTDEEISNLLEKYSGKEDKLVFGLINKYPQHLIRKEKMKGNSKIEL